MKSIIVTGASKGLGAAITKSLLEKGHRVIGVARSKEGLGQFKQFNGFTSICGDVCDGRTLEQVNISVKAHGVDGLILNAGSTWPISRIADLNIEQFKQYYHHFRIAL